MRSARQDWFEGWRLFGVLTLTLIALCIWIAGMRQFEADGVRMVIRFTARTSLLLFCLAFSAAALARLHPSGLDAMAAPTTAARSASASRPRTACMRSRSARSRRWTRPALLPPPTSPLMCSAASAMPSSSR